MAIPTLPLQGLGLVGTVIRVGGIPLAGHLQLINWVDTHEIEVTNDGPPDPFQLRIDQTDPATFNRSAGDIAFTGALDLGSRQAGNVWQVAIQAAHSIEAAGLTYELTTQNSNSFINSLFLGLGLNINSYLPAATPSNVALGFVGVETDIRNKVAFTIAGTSGDDWFFAGAKNDTLYGGAGNDIYYGGGGNDAIALGSGRDYAEGGAGTDTIYGGGDTDTLSYFGSAAGVTVNLAYNYAVGGDAQGDVIGAFENVTGSNTGNDIIAGNALANVILGQNGNDWLSGQAGSDVLMGGGGSDYLLGGQGSDFLYGGTADADYAYIYGADVISGDIDYLMDFSAASGDYVLLPVALQASVSFVSYAGYALGYILTGSGSYTFAAANTSVADLQSHTYFF